MDLLIKYIPNSDHYFFDKNYILNHFKNIHPNYITIIGIISNLIVVLSYYNKNFFIFSLFTIIRSICDILDGLIARKFKKVSYIGGILDTISDSQFCCITIFIILNSYFNFNISFGITLIYFFFHIYSMFKSGNLSDHSGLKKNPKTLSQLIVYILIKNTFIFHLIFLFYLKYYNYKRIFC